MITGDNAGRVSKNSNKIDDFRKNHADMENELKRRLQMIRKKNLRLFLKQINAL